MTAHRYWRFSFNAADGGTSLSVAEIALRGSPGGANLAALTPSAYSGSLTLSAGSGMSVATGNGSAGNGYAFESTIQGVNGGVASRTLTLSANGMISGNYTVDSEGNFDLMQIRIDGATQIIDSGLGHSGSFSYPVTAGSVVEFRYQKDGSNSSGTDKATWSNVVVNGSFTSTAQYSVNGGVALFAFDNDASTIWNAAAASGWLQVVFDSAQDIVEHAITAPASGLTNAPKNWVLQYSDNGIDWMAASVVGGQSGWSSNEQRVFNHATWSAAVGYCSQRPALASALNADTAPASVTTSAPYSAGLQASPMLSGTVLVGGQPVSRRVRAHCRLDGSLLGEALSDPVTGVFQINARGRTDFCTLTALDDLTLAPDMNAVIADLVLPM